MSSSPDAGMAADALRRSLLREIGIILGIALVLFVGAINLPVAAWLDFVVQHHQTYLFDELIFVFVLLSFVFPVFTVRRWRDLRRESRARFSVIGELERTARLNAQLGQMSALLHSCISVDEASTIVSHYARQLFPNHAGALYVFRSSRNLLELAAEWGASHEQTLAPNHCWALRQGQLYEIDESSTSVTCLHAKDAHPYICLPMMAHGEVLALLYVHATTGTTVTSDASQRGLLQMFAEHIALAFSNLKLREALRQLSVRDPLTGLFNRRYLEETLAIEVERARRANEPFSVVMLDLDHFKRFNDTHGHDAGDAVLRLLGGFLQRHVRAGDVACRYGGEEFSLVLPGASLAAALERAGQLCEAIRALHVDFKGESLGPLTLSAGVASFPDHGETSDAVLQAADAALYQAKRDGRDRAVIAA